MRKQNLVNYNLIYFTTIHEFCSYYLNCVEQFRKEKEEEQRQKILAQKKEEAKKRMEEKAKQAILVKKKKPKTATRILIRKYDQIRSGNIFRHQRARATSPRVDPVPIKEKLESPPWKNSISRQISARSLGSNSSKKRK